MGEQSLSLDSLKETEKLARRHLILSAAISLFSEKSFSQVSIREIAKTAGISPALIYRHFKDKEDLFLGVIEKHYGTLIAEIERRKQNNTYNLESFVTDYIESNLEYFSFFKLMTQFSISGDLNDENAKRYEDTIRPLLKAVEALIKKSNPNSSPFQSSRSLIAALNGILITYAGRPSTTDEEIKSTMVELAKFTALKLCQV